jgi:mycothiol synthase
MESCTLRPVAESDLEAICALVVRAEQFDGYEKVMTLDELREELDDELVSFAADTRVAVRIEDGVERIAGFAYVAFLPGEPTQSPGVGQQRVFVLGHVDPVCRRQGVGSALLSWGTERAREQLLAADNGLPMFIRVDAYESATASLRLHARQGFQQVRLFEELLRPLDELPPVACPRGVSLLPWPDPADEVLHERLRTVKNEAFADHWGSTPTTRERWRLMVNSHIARLDLSCIAVDDATGDIVGCCLNERFESDDELLGRRDGWIGTLATSRAWRGRGVASAMIRQSLHWFAAAGLTHASIGVDGDSLTGAARLYRSLGFEVRKRSITSQIEVPSQLAGGAASTSP